jgi:hypothetical protein
MMLLSSKIRPKIPPNGVFFTLKTPEKYLSGQNFSPKVTFLKSHSQNTYDSTLKM